MGITMRQHGNNDKRNQCKAVILIWIEILLFLGLHPKIDLHRYGDHHRDLKATIKCCVPWPKEDHAICRRNQCEAVILIWIDIHLHLGVHLKIDLHHCDDHHQGRKVTIEYCVPCPEEHHAICHLFHHSINEVEEDPLVHLNRDVQAHGLGVWILCFVTLTEVAAIIKP
jgi:hypothetical protein